MEKQICDPLKTYIVMTYCDEVYCGLYLVNSFQNAPKYSQSYKRKISFVMKETEFFLSGFCFRPDSPEALSLLTGE